MLDIIRRYDSSCRQAGEIPGHTPTQLDTRTVVLKIQTESHADRLTTLSSSWSFASTRTSNRSSASIISLLAAMLPRVPWYRITDWILQYAQQTQLTTKWLNKNLFLTECITLVASLSSVSSAVHSYSYPDMAIWQDKDAMTSEFHSPLTWLKLWITRLSNSEQFSQMNRWLKLRHRFVYVLFWQLWGQCNRKDASPKWHRHVSNRTLISTAQCSLTLFYKLPFLNK